MSAVKHTPATPLPWGANDDDVGTQINSLDENGEPDIAVARLGNLENWVDEIVDVGRDDADREDRDAAYIAHAANAYPRLIEYVRGVGGPVGAALLRELGESS